MVAVGKALGSVFWRPRRTSGVPLFVAVLARQRVPRPADVMLPMRSQSRPVLSLNQLVHGLCCRLRDGRIGRRNCQDIRAPGILGIAETPLDSPEVKRRDRGYLFVASLHGRLVRLTSRIGPALLSLKQAQAECHQRYDRLCVLALNRDLESCARRLDVAKIGFEKSKVRGGGRGNVSVSRLDRHVEHRAGQFRVAVVLLQHAEFKCRPSPGCILLRDSCG